jgi:pilus assembly protein Flp/PilA
VLTYLGIVLTARLSSERGASAVEYGLLVAGVLLVCASAFEVLSDGVQAVFTETNSDLSGP